MQEFVSNASWEMHVFLNPKKSKSRNQKTRKNYSGSPVNLNSQHRNMGTSWRSSG